MMKLDVSMFRKAQVFGWALEAPRVSWASFWHVLTAFRRPVLEDFGALSGHFWRISGLGTALGKQFNINVGST